MSFYSPPSNTQTDRERYLEYELGIYREQEERRQHEAEEQRRQREQERRDRREEEMRTAATWPEALQKQAYLCRREDAHNPPVDDDDNYFAMTAEACAAALDLWGSIAADRQPQIDELLKQIEQIQDGIRLEVADRLEKLRDAAEYRQVAEALRTEDINNWLYW